MAIIKKQSMSAQVIDHILGQIENGDLKPGDKLPNERDFAESLGISRVPLREAICALTAFGILSPRQGDGTVVNSFNEGILGRIMYIYTILDEVSASELMELRVNLEAASAAAAAERRTEEDLAEIRKAQEQYIHEYEMLKAQEIGIDMVLKADHEFHIAIGKAAKNKLYREFLEALRTPFTHLEFSDDIETNLRNFSQSIAFHDDIAKAITNGDRSAAYSIMEQHILEVSRKLNP